MKSLGFKLRVILPAPPDEVFRALTSSRIIARWSGQKRGVEARIGGKFELFDGWVKGRVIQFERGKLLGHTWLPGDWPEGALESVVKYRFSSARNGTKVELVHRGFPSVKERNNHRRGWSEFVFQPLRAYLLSQEKS